MPREPQFEATKKTLGDTGFIKYEIQKDKAAITFHEFLQLLLSDFSFRLYFNNLLSECPFDAFRWETPKLTSSLVSRPFEFVVHPAPSFPKRRTDRRTFSSFWSDAEAIGTPNLSGDAYLVIPTPQTDEDIYGHLASFCRNAPESQVDAFWQLVAENVQDRLSENATWLSTAGGGVAWLHVRLDNTPKYYGYAPYRSES